MADPVSCRAAMARNRMWSRMAVNSSCLSQCSGSPLFSASGWTNSFCRTSTESAIRLSARLRAGVRRRQFWKADSAASPFIRPAGPIDELQSAAVTVGRSAPSTKLWLISKSVNCRSRSARDLRGNCARCSVTPANTRRYARPPQLRVGYPTLLFGKWAARVEPAVGGLDRVRPRAFQDLTGGALLRVARRDQRTSRPACRGAAGFRSPGRVSVRTEFQRGGTSGTHP